MDIQTLAAILGLASLLQVIALSAQWRANGARPGLGSWTLGSAAFAAGFLANALRDAPQVGPYAIVATLAAFMLGAALNYAGVLAFFHHRPPVGRLAMFLALSLALTAWFTLGHDNLAGRRVVVSGCFAVLSFLTMRALRAGRRTSVATSVSFLTMVFGCIGAFFLVRAVAPLAGTVDGPFTPARMQVATFLVIFSGGILWSFGFIILMNQRLNAESQEAGEHFQAIFNTSPDAVMITRVADGRILNINEGFTALTGYAPADALGKTTLELGLWVDPGDRNRMGEALRGLGSGQSMEFRFRRKDQSTLSGLFTAKYVTLHGERHILSVTQDITERKRDAQRIQELVTQLGVERDYAEASARTDALTRLPNRGQFDEVLHTEFYRLKRSGGPLSLIILDVDHFKLFNDTFGHLAGDDCLRRLGHALKGIMGRPSDLPARYGGEEFAVILPETGPSGALALAERIRRAVEDLAIPHPGGSVVTVSLGTVTRAGTSLASPYKLIELADEALYLAKQRGRNRVEAARAELGGDAAVHADLVRLVWRETGESGNPQVDGQHRGLFEGANRLLSAVLGGLPPADTAPLMHRYLEDIVNHFREEEAVLRAAGYPQAEEHAVIHAELEARARAMALRFERDELSLGELFGFLAYEVVAQHMLREDRKFFPYV